MAMFRAHPITIATAVVLTAGALPLDAWAQGGTGRALPGPRPGITSPGAPNPNAGGGIPTQPMVTPAPIAPRALPTPPGLAGAGQPFDAQGGGNGQPFAQPLTPAGPRPTYPAPLPPGAVQQPGVAAAPNFAAPNYPAPLPPGAAQPMRPNYPAPLPPGAAQQFPAPNYPAPTPPVATRPTYLAPQPPGVPMPPSTFAGPVVPPATFVAPAAPRPLLPPAQPLQPGQPPQVQPGVVANQPPIPPGPQPFIPVRLPPPTPINVANQPQQPAILPGPQPLVPGRLPPPPPVNVANQPQQPAILPGPQPLVPGRLPPPPPTAVANPSPPPLNRNANDAALRARLAAAMAAGEALQNQPVPPGGFAPRPLPPPRVPGDDPFGLSDTRNTANQVQVPTIGRVACGPAACAMIANDQGRDVDIRTLASDAGISQTGTNIVGLAQAMQFGGVRHARPVANVTTGQLLQATSRGHAAVVRVRNPDGTGHFVVVDGIAEVTNPQTGASQFFVAVRDPWGGQRYSEPLARFAQRYDPTAALLTNPPSP